MERLDIFLDKLRQQGININCNWQIERGKGSIEHYTISEGPRFCMVLFHIHGQKEGFHTYIETGSNDFAEDIEAIKKQLNADI